MPKIERRFIAEEVRLEGDEGKLKIAGHAAKFDSWSRDLGGFREKISKGAFKKSIKEDDVRALFNHDPSLLLGRTKAGTLALSEDKEGLYMEVDPPGTQLGRDLMELIERGDISQQSFSFSVEREEWAYPKDKPAERTLEEVKLYDVSPVTFPAYEDTDVTVALRSMEENKPSAPEGNDAGGEVSPKARPKLTQSRHREIKKRIG